MHNLPLPVHLLKLIDVPNQERCPFLLPVGRLIDCRGSTVRLGIRSMAVIPQANQGLADVMI